MYIITVLVLIYTFVDNVIITSALRERKIGPVEYCDREDFNATCKENEVIMIQDARYGRMKIGRCVKLNLGFLGCVANVTTELASRCSGRRQCVVRVADDLLYSKNPCVADTVSHLQVTYKCVQVITANPSSCHRHKRIAVREQSGLLTTDPTRRIGTGDCPWEILVQPGQKINLTLYSFVDTKASSNSNSAISDGTCLKVATVQEEDTVVKKILGCLSHLQQRQHVYTSYTSTVRIVAERNNIIPPSVAFLIEFKASGCPNIAVKGKEVVTYDKDRNAKVHCNHTKQTWYMTCMGTKWIGDAEDCIYDGGQSGSMFVDNSFPYGLLIAVAIGVALGVFCGGMLLTLVVVHKKRKRRTPTQLMTQNEGVYYGTKQDHQQAHQMHQQHYEPATHYCTEMSSLTRASNENILCPTHHHSATTTSPPNTTVSPEGAPLEFREFCMKPDQQPDLFQMDKNCTISKERVKFSDKQNHNQTSVR